MKISTKGVDMFIQRALSLVLDRFTKFPVIALLGPRQSGKTTLARHYFPQHKFVTLEALDTREFALRDPRGFLREHQNDYGIIIDEFQHAPDLLSYIQVDVDEKKRPGYFILTGSQNFLMNQAITQSLAGRVGILTLLPLSIQERLDAGLLGSANEAIFNGGYPRVYDQQIDPLDFYPSYVHTYVERDVRLLDGVGDMVTFQKFMRLCAGRVGQLLNISDLATQCGISQAMVKSWLSVLEASYIIFLLQPYHNNFNKRLVKTPKLYFYDTGLACSLLGIRSVEELSLTSFRGPLFESFVLSDFFKQYCNMARVPALYFWRDLNGRIEVDCLIERISNLVPVEIKSGETIDSSYFAPMNKWSEMADTPAAAGFVVYGGQERQRRSNGTVLSWVSAGSLIASLEAAPQASEL